MDKRIILARIDELLEEKHISKYQLKENSEVSSTIYQWRKNASRDKARTPSLKSIEKICEFFNVSLSYFFAFDKDTQKNVKNKEVIESLNQLDSEQLELVEKIIKQFTSRS